MPVVRVPSSPFVVFWQECASNMAFCVCAVVVGDRSSRIHSADHCEIDMKKNFDIPNRFDCCIGIEQVLAGVAYKNMPSSQI